MKKPLMGSVMSSFTISLDSLVAKSLIAAR